MLHLRSAYLFCVSLLLVVIVASGTGAVSLALAKTLVVGPDQEIKTLGDAARAAGDGDTIEIEPVKGGWFDCANWRASHLTIEGKGDGVIITDRTCDGKGLFITTGNEITIRNLTFQRARVPDRNGAGIRAQGANLRVEHSRFVNNENGILSGPAPDGKIFILDSEFIGNGKCDTDCAHAIYIGKVALLHVEHCVFKDTHQGHNIKSRALRTELIGNDIEDGQTGTSSYLVDIPDGGSLIMKNNTLEKGPNSDNHSTAVVIGEEGVKQPTDEITISNNKFTNDIGTQTRFVRNFTATPATLTGNTLTGKITALDGDGAVQ